MKLLNIQEATPFPCVIGLDFGTTHSVIAWSQGGPANIITTPHYPNGLIPSKLYSAPDGTLITPNSDQKTWPSEALAPLRHIKRLLNTSATPPDNLGYPVTRSSSGLWSLNIRGNTYEALDLVTTFLTYLYTYAQKHLGCTIDHVVIAVPAYFSEPSRLALRQAASQAGLPLLRLINEPTSAGLIASLDETPLFGVYDMGGGTFDFSVLRGQGDLTEVLGVGGDTHLGGADMDLRIARHIDKAFEMRSSMLQNHILQLSKKLKEQLSYCDEVAYTLPSNFEGRLDLSTLNTLIEPLIERSVAACQKVLKNLQQDHGEFIKTCICIGGTSKIPRITSYLQERLGVTTYCSSHPEHAVALGTATYGRNLVDPASESLLLDITPFSLGLEVLGGVEFFMPRYTPLPFSVSKVFTTAQSHQEVLELHVLQGQHASIATCTSLARLAIPLPPLPAKKLRLTVTFTLDVEGILHIKACDEQLGLQQTLSVNPANIPQTLKPDSLQELT